jgi:putrescine transport system substrate-binding protein
MLEATLLTGHSGYDVVVVGGNQLERLGRAHVFRELERAQLPNWGNLDTEVMARLATEDSGNRYAVAYDWGTTGIGLNLSKLRQVAPDLALDSWRLVFDPATLARISKCGVSFVDAPTELVAVALVADGKDPNTTDPALLEAAGRKLMAIRPYVRKIDSDMQIADFASGDTCLMVTWPANYVGGRRRSTEAGGHDEYRYVIPREGTDSWIDALAIPADAPHIAEAHAFINFLMRPDIAARGADFLGNATANQAALPHVDARQRNDAGIYPPPEMRAKLVPLHSRPDAANRSVTRIWTRFRTSH